MVDASIKKAPLWFTSRGLQLPKLVQTIIDANTKISQNESGVNSNSMQEDGNYAGNIRYSLSFYSTEENDVNRIGWAEELFTDEDKMLLNDRFVDIMIRKDLGDAVRLKGRAYLLDINNKIVIIGGSFQNPVIHYVMVINADNATYAQDIKEVIFNHEQLRNSNRQEASDRLRFYETLLGQEVIRGYDKENFGYHAETGFPFASLPRNFKSYGYTAGEQDGGGVSGENGSYGKVSYSLDTVEETEESVGPSADAMEMGEANETEGRLETEDEIYNRIGWAYDVLTPEDMHVVQQQIAEAGIQGYDSFCKFTDTDTNQTMLALAANNNIVIVNDDFEFPVIHAVVQVSDLISIEINDVIRLVKEDYDEKHKNQKGRSRSPLEKFIKIVQDQIGQTFTLVYKRTNYISTGTNRSGRNQGTGTHRYGGTGSQNSGGKPYGRRNSRKNVHVIGAHDNDNGTITIYYSNGDQRILEKGSKESVRYSLDTLEETEEAVGPSADAIEMGEATARMDEMARNHGRIAQGERVKRDIAVPRKINGKKTMRWARTFFESGVGAPEMVDAVSEELLNEGLSYRAISDEKALNEAEADIQSRGYQQSLSRLEAEVDEGKISKDMMARGQLLLNAAAENKDYDAFKRLVVLISEMGTIAGQTVQAASMLKKMDGETKLFAVKRAIDRINRDLQSGKYGSKGVDTQVSWDDIKRPHGAANTITVDQDLILRLLQAQDDDVLSSAIVVEIQKDVARQLPHSFNDAWNAWRYFSMLCNPTTHIRNFGSGVLSIPVVGMKNTIKAVAEQVLQTEQRTTKILPASRQAKEFARADAQKMKTFLQSGGKHNPESIVEQVRKKQPGLFDALSKWNSAALEAEDWCFLRYHYVSTLSRYLDANHIRPDTITEEQLQKARDYAATEAMKATFRDASKLANAIYNFSKSNKGANLFVEAVLPFKKTPINILKRGIEYSPVGLVNTMKKGIVSLTTKNADHKITLNEWLDGMAAGMTGSMIVALGMWMYSMGWVQASFGSDDDDKEDKAMDQLKRLSGYQEFSLIIGGYSYTIDWAAPVAIPFFMGAELAEALEEEDGSIYDKALDMIIDGSDVVVNMSMLSGLQGLIDGIKYDDSAIIGLFVNSPINYVGQAIPTVLGKIANTADDKSRSNYIDKGDDTPDLAEEVKNKFLAKIPGASSKRNAYVDAFGREKKTGSLGRRLFQNFLSPGYLSEINYGELETVMEEIYKNADEPSPIPSTANKYLKVNGETVHLSAEQYEQYAKKRGTVAHQIMLDMIHNEHFKSLDADEKMELLKSAYDYSNEFAKQAVSDYVPKETGWQEKAKDLEARGDLSVADYIVCKNSIPDGADREEVIEILQQHGLDYEESRRYLYHFASKMNKEYVDMGMDVDVVVGQSLQMEKGDYSNYESTIAKLKADGFSEEDVVKALHAESGIDGRYKKGCIYYSGDLYYAIINNSKDYDKIFKSLLRLKIKAGRSQKQALSDLRTSVEPKFKKAYMEGNATERAKIKTWMINSRLYSNKNDVLDKIYKWSQE